MTGVRRIAGGDQLVRETCFVAIHDWSAPNQGGARALAFSLIADQKTKERCRAMPAVTPSALAQVTLWAERVMSPAA
jgi:hypothetical protein